MTRRGLWALAAGTAYLAQANAAWLRAHLPERPPDWDRALYLWLSVRFLHALQDGGLPALAGEFLHRSTTVAPLLPLSTLPSYLLAGESRLAAHATTSLYLALLLASAFALGRRLRGPGCGLLAAFVLATCPGVTLAGRDYMMDLPGAALATAAVALLVESDFGGRRRLALAAGAFAGLTLLTKTMAAVFLAAPAAEALWRSRGRAGVSLNLAAALAVALLVAAAWWAPNHAEALAYLWRYGFTADALPFAAGGASPFSWRNLAYYPEALVNEGLGPIAAAALLLALLPPARPDGVPLRWLGLSLALLTAVPNKSGDRYILGLLPAASLLVAGAVARARPPKLRLASGAALLLAGAFTHVGLTYDVGWPRLYFHLRTGLIAARRSATPVPAGVENPWPVAAVVTAARKADASVPPAQLPPAALVRAAYLRLLKRTPDAQGSAAYTGALERGALTPDALFREIAASPEFAARPARVLVVPDHAFVNASVLRYYAERLRRAVAFDHPRALPAGALADHYDAALLKIGGGNGPEHTRALVPEIERRLRAEAARWRSAGRFDCPDGSEIELLASDTF